MATYEKVTTTTIDEDHVSVSVHAARSPSTGVVDVRTCTAIPGSSDEADLSVALPVAADRTALKALLKKIAQGAMTRMGATVKP